MSSENVSASEESGPVTEADYNELFCEDVGGKTEVRHQIQLWGRQRVTWKWIARRPIQYGKVD